VKEFHEQFYITEINYSPESKGDTKAIIRKDKSTCYKVLCFFAGEEVAVFAAEGFLVTAL